MLSYIIFTGAPTLHPLRHLFMLVCLAALSFPTFAAQPSQPLLVSIRPLAFIVQDLAPDLSVSVLIQGAQSPHHFQAKFSDIRRIKDADLLIWVGPGLETMLEEAIDTLRASDSVLELSTLSGLNYPDVHGHAHGVDPHLWLSTVNAAIIAEAISLKLVALFPHQKAEFETRLTAFLNALDVHKTQQLARLKAYEGRYIGAYHDAYGHYLNDYGIEQRGHATLNPEEALSLKQVRHLQRELDGAQCMLAETGERQSAEKLADMLKLPLVEMDLLAVGMELDPAGEHPFLQYMSRLDDAMLRCLAGE